MLVLAAALVLILLLNCNGYTTARAHFSLYAGRASHKLFFICLQEWLCKFPAFLLAWLRQL